MGQKERSITGSNRRPFGSLSILAIWNEGGELTAECSTYWANRAGDDTDEKNTVYNYNPWKQSGTLILLAKEIQNMHEVFEDCQQTLSFGLEELPKKLNLFTKFFMFVSLHHEW